MKVDVPTKASHGLDLNQARGYIQSFDLTPIIQRLIYIQGWSRKSTLKAVQLYRNYLFIRKKYSDEGPLIPSYEIDEVWHAHVLHTKDYIRFCNTVFGAYLHHHPHLVEQGGGVSNFAAQFEKTQVLHKKEFGDYIYHIKRRPIYICLLLRKIFSKLSHANG